MTLHRTGFRARHTLCTVRDLTHHPHSLHGCDVDRWLQPLHSLLTPHRHGHLNGSRKNTIDPDIFIRVIDGIGPSHGDYCCFTCAVRRCFSHQPKFICSTLMFPLILTTPSLLIILLAFHSHQPPIKIRISRKKETYELLFSPRYLIDSQY